MQKYSVDDGWQARRQVTAASWEFNTQLLDEAEHDIKNYPDLDINALMHCS